MSVVTITGLAKSKLLHVIRSSGAKNAILRLEAAGGNGKRYIIEADKTIETKQGDAIISLISEGSDIHQSSLWPSPYLRVCGKSKLHVIGTTIDWSSDFMGDKFVFTNPNWADTCGCGYTFIPTI
jgi:Fe-S cluster assembly iron-binding protein IscA